MSRPIGSIAFVIGLFLTGTLPATAGAVRIQYVMLAAYGTTAGSAEYVVRLIRAGSSTAPISSLELDWATARDSGILNAPTVLNVAPAVTAQIADSMQFALIVKNPNLRYVSIRYFTVDRQSGRINSEEDRYDISGADAVTPMGFDDSAPWIGALPAVFAFLSPSDGSAGVARIIQPEYPELAREQQASGSVVLIVDLNGNGSVFDVEILSSSVGGLLSEAAISAARGTTYLPIYLVTPGGNKATPNRFPMGYLFRADQ
jgi:TonB family protein